MGLNDTPSGERLHIGFFGRRNAGKSSVVNAITGQDLAVVSDTKGTTTDPVSKAMELLPIGPVMIIDTPGFDDEGELGLQRVQRTKRILNRTDVAVLVADVTQGLGACEEELMALFREKQLPHLIIWNKSDLLEKIPAEGENEIYVSALQGTNIYECKEKIGKIGNIPQTTPPLISDMVKPCDIAVLVIPIDKAAPKGRLILPQQQVIRDLLDAGAVPVCVRNTELRQLLDTLSPAPAVVITDSQAFEEVAREVPREIPLTSFSILMARHKGSLVSAAAGAAAIDRLRDGDTVLISEGCTHHRQCDDIGTVKLPRWLAQHTGKQLHIETSSGRDFPEDLSRYALIIHCGACMLNEREVQYRMKCAADSGVPMTNYGIAIAHMKGILRRSVELFPNVSALFGEA